MPLDRTQRAHRLAGLVYLLYALGFLFGITALIGVIINHTNLSKTQKSYAHSHFIWQIISFWLLLFGVALSIALWQQSYGRIIGLACVFWWIASGLTGIYFLIKRMPMPFTHAFNKYL